MNSEIEQPSAGRRLGAIAVIIVGGILGIRLVAMGLASLQSDPPESMEVFRAKMARAGEFEREQSRQMWIDAGYPADEFEKVWKSASGRGEEETMRASHDGTEDKAP